MNFAKINFFIMIVLFISCTSQNPVPETSDFNRGYEGIEFEFVENRPTTTIYSEDSVPVALRFHNRGSTLLSYENPAVISLSYDNFYLSFSGVNRINPTINYFPQNLGLLHPKSMFFPHGEISQDISLGIISSRELQGQVQSPNTELFVNVCYPYNTTFHTVTCVNSDFYLTDERQEVCDVKIISDFEGQGGPIAVTKITPRITLVRDFNQNMPIGPDGSLVSTAVQEVKPLFEIEIQNKNDGVPYAVLGRSSRDFCELDSLERRRDINKVEVSAFLDPSEENPGILDCNHLEDGETTAYLRLVNGKGTVFCELADDATIVAAYNYLAQLTVHVDYFYSEGRALDLEIVRKQFD